MIMVYRYEAYVLYTFMQLLIHFLGGENNLIVHLEFKVTPAFQYLLLLIIEKNHLAMALRWTQASLN